MGFIQASLTTPFYFSPEHGFELREQDLKRLSLDAQMDDLSWTRLFIGDEVDLRGELDAHIEVEVREIDELHKQGEIQGQNSRVKHLEDRVGLLDGTSRERRGTR